jgi:hypothetical protein
MRHQGFCGETESYSPVIVERIQGKVELSPVCCSARSDTEFGAFPANTSRSTLQTKHISLKINAIIPALPYGVGPMRSPPLASSGESLASGALATMADFHSIFNQCSPLQEATLEGGAFGESRNPSPC